MPSHLVGHGLDAHRLIVRRPLVLAGVRIDDSARGPDARSDGDVVLHALADAMLSSVSRGDIGDLFPPADPVWQDLDSRRIVEAALEALAEAGARLVNAVVVVTLDAPPRLADYREAMRRSLAELLGLDVGRMGVTFKTSEGLAPDHVQASAVVLVQGIVATSRSARLVAEDGVPIDAGETPPAAADRSVRRPGERT